MCTWWMEDLIPWRGKGRAKERTEGRLMIGVGEGDRSVQIVEFVAFFCSFCISFGRLLVRSFVPSAVHSLVRLVICLFAHSFVRSFILYSFG